MVLDGTVVSAAFDDVMDMGIVGTTAGTLWYINWTDNTSIRLISGHKTKVCPHTDTHHTHTQENDLSIKATASLPVFLIISTHCVCV